MTALHAFEYNDFARCRFLIAAILFMSKSTLYPYEIYRVNSYTELTKAVERIVLPPGKLRLFRGQRRDYGGKMLVSSARQTSTNTLLVQLLDWLPMCDVWQIVQQLKKGAPPNPAKVPFANTGSSPAWQQGMITHVDSAILYHPLVDEAQIEAAAMMQHYGAVSEFLDCTSSLEVALWFSHNNLQATNIESTAED